MWLSILLSLLGIFSWYLTSRHQLVLKLPINKFVGRSVTVIFFWVALIIWFNHFSVSAAIFIFLTTIMSAFVVIPLMCAIFSNRVVSK